jgi:DnaJ-class molecular chaperone
MSIGEKAVIIIIVILALPALLWIYMFLTDYISEKINEPKELKEGEASIFIYERLCPDCDGLGYYEEKTDDYQGRETIECSRCNGSGHHESGEKTLRSKMFSSGLKYLAECPKCKGSGSILNTKGKRVRCKTCHGIGEVYSAKSNEKIS